MVKFRKIEVKELPGKTQASPVVEKPAPPPPPVAVAPVIPAPPVAPAPAKEEKPALPGFALFFNGKDLTGWEG